ncbi:MAG: ABC transporter ATP-binding protein [Bryobacteraceae bacterium]|nr:ABC transporter ATP-binding protein [Bryobacteraceae bacterium]
MLQAINLTKGFNNKIVLSGLNFEVLPGELFCLLGETGAGKSVTMALFLNLLKSTSGNCLVGGFNVSLQPAKPKSLLAYVPPVMPLYEQLTGMENLQYFSSMAGFLDWKPGDAQRLFKDLGLAQELLDQPASTYSVVVRQRIGLAIAVSRDAKALLLDEPTQHMDSAAAEEYVTLVKAYAEGDILGQPAAVLLATSSAEIAAEFSHKVGFLKNGKLVDILEADDIGRREYVERCHEFCPAPAVA